MKVEHEIAVINSLMFLLVSNLWGIAEALFFIVGSVVGTISFARVMQRRIKKDMCDCGHPFDAHYEYGCVECDCKVSIDRRMNL